MDQCALKATFAEQYLDLEINPSLIKLWQKEGYVALHFEAVRQPWVAFTTPPKPLPIYDQILEILRKEKRKSSSSPPEESSLITWPPPEKCNPSQNHYSTIPSVQRTEFCMMTSQEEFPPLEKRTTPITRVEIKPFVTKTEVTTDGRMKALSQAEEVLNWLTENALAQNTWLKEINQKIEKMHISMDQDIKLLSTKLQTYHQELKAKIGQLEKEISEVKEIHKLSMDIINKQRSLDKAKEQYEELV
uniref:Uncharacterized protein n=1 Tax=Cajanus cajan TaxID=3821 RepID=A0A151RSZ7_CAJCA|nr:hypothetical protein KK1_032765 [Cajanus cajan]